LLLQRLDIFGFAFYLRFANLLLQEKLLLSDLRAVFGIEFGELLLSSSVSGTKARFF